MKNIRIIAATICLTLVMAGCSEEFLELSPQQSVGDTQALVAFGDFESSISAVYSGIGSASYYGRYFMLLPDRGLFCIIPIPVVISLITWS